MYLEEIIFYLSKIDPKNFRQLLRKSPFPIDILIQQADSGDVVAGNFLYKHYSSLKKNKNPIPRKLQKYLNNREVENISTGDFYVSYRLKKKGEKGCHKHMKLLRDIGIAYKVYKKYKANYLLSHGVDIDLSKVNPPPGIVEIYREVAKEFNNSEQPKEWGIMTEDNVGRKFIGFREAINYIEQINKPIRDALNKKAIY